MHSHDSYFFYYAKIIYLGCYIYEDIFIYTALYIVFEKGSYLSLVTCPHLCSCNDIKGFSLSFYACGHIIL